MVGGTVPDGVPCGGPCVDTGGAGARAEGDEGGQVTVVPQLRWVNSGPSRPGRAGGPVGKDPCGRDTDWGPEEKGSVGFEHWGS